MLNERGSYCRNRRTSARRAHHTQEPGAAEARQRDLHWYPHSLLDEAGDRVGSGATDHEGRRLRHSDVYVACDGDSETEDGQESP